MMVFPFQEGIEVFADGTRFALGAESVMALRSQQNFFIEFQLHKRPTDLFGGDQV
jgi:hypothetical protein